MKIPKIRPHLLWEYDLSSFDYQRQAVVVIERVVERGNVLDWKELIRFYGRARINKVVAGSPRLSKKDRKFTPLFLRSNYLEC